MMLSYRLTKDTFWVITSFDCFWLRSRLCMAYLVTANWYFIKNLGGSASLVLIIVLKINVWVNLSCKKATIDDTNVQIVF